jgi:cytochrome c-type biogenesis protein CcmH/NrfG
MLGSVHYKMKDYEAAQEAYEAALALEPENEDVQAYLATVNWYIEHPQAEGG